ncbi:hypothetical protein DB30_03904 [Enhygromyxa salina]|uniref:Uncharacterized protein n=1 Tax=Enhygromyxa salina TaxID=215803 RepID=A0A0C2A7A4_9BACT|nr:hypothetical protein [Enhygromyxa salina]KIG19348.1 hypothetical protein DB30_03904 [Enhygromyxa salina]
MLASLLFLAWSNIPPYRMHIKKVRWGVGAWHWRLYEHGGLGVCDVRYFDMNRDGAPIERWKLLGYDRPGDMPDAIARTHDKQLRAAYAQVCEAQAAAGDPHPNVQVMARCGRKLGWATVEKRRANVCGKKTGKKRKKTKRGTNK